MCVRVCVCVHVCVCAFDIQLVVKIIYSSTKVRRANYLHSVSFTCIFMWVGGAGMVICVIVWKYNTCQAVPGYTGRTSQSREIFNLKLVAVLFCRAPHLMVHLPYIMAMWRQIFRNFPDNCFAGCIDYHCWKTIDAICLIIRINPLSKTLWLFKVSHKSETTWLYNPSTSQVSELIWGMPCRYFGFPKILIIDSATAL